MHDEPTGVRPALQSPRRKGCPACQQPKHRTDASTTPTGLSSSCQDCQRASSRLASRRRQAAIRLLIAFHPEEYQALLELIHSRTSSAPPGRREVAAMRPERPECQCLACAQLQHHQANDTLLLLAIGTIVVVGGLVWLVGQLAGLLTSGVWPDVPLSELPGILVRLRDHAGDPAAAWPAGVRDRLPGPLGMYATLAGILATPLALGALAWWLHQPPAPPRPPATPTPRGRRALPPAVHPDLPMLPPPEHGEAP